jgi:hypothetical protein
MPYIGKTPLTGAYQLCDTITTSATATYNLLVGGSAVIPGAAQNCIVSLNGVVQAPVGAYTVSGSTIVFASTLSATDVIDFILILGNVFDIGKPTDGSVTNASVSASAAIALSKLATTGTITLDNIQFPATAVPSANANNLDDYEEGTFTPALVRSGVTFTYTSRSGNYIKIGNIVITDFNMNLSTHDGSTGSAVTSISGFPFTSSSTQAGSFIMFNNNTGTQVGVGRGDNLTTTVGVMTATIATNANLYVTLIYRT